MPCLNTDFDALAHAVEAETYGLRTWRIDSYWNNLTSGLSQDDRAAFDDFEKFLNDSLDQMEAQLNKFRLVANAHAEAIHQIICDERETHPRSRQLLEQLRGMLLDITEEFEISERPELGEALEMMKRLEVQLEMASEKHKEFICRATEDIDKVINSQ